MPLIFLDQAELTVVREITIICWDSIPLGAAGTAANGIALDKIDESPADARVAGRITGKVSNMGIPSQRSIGALLWFAGATSVAWAQATPEEASGIDHGRALVVENCSGCHAVGPDGSSPHPRAPAFRQLGDRFPIDALEETFIDSIDTGHPGMPVFDALTLPPSSIQL